MLEGTQRGLSHAMLAVYTPRRSIIIDMIMVQFIAIIIVMMLVLFVQGPALNSSMISFFLVGIFISVLMLSSIYTRITR